VLPFAVWRRFPRKLLWVHPCCDSSNIRAAKPGRKMLNMGLVKLEGLTALQVAVFKRVFHLALKQPDAIFQHQRVNPKGGFVRDFC
jgi:hypothetical protein